MQLNKNAIFEPLVKDNIKRRKRYSIIGRSYTLDKLVIWQDEILKSIEEVESRYGRRVIREIPIITMTNPSWTSSSSSFLVNSIDDARKLEKEGYKMPVSSKDDDDNLLTYFPFKTQDNMLLGRVDFMYGAGITRIHEHLRLVLDPIGFKGKDMVEYLELSNVLLKL